jgi:MoaA/NifB/PqqE/SkfB family radical SAM enzyme
MQFQTLSVVVPTGRCVNACPFCVSRMHESPYEWILEESVTSKEKQEAYFRQYKRRLQFAQDNGSNTIVFTGTAEPIQNKKFIKRVVEINESIRKPFQWLEIQTTGVYLLHQQLPPYTNLDFLYDLGLSTIALSIVDPFSDENNLKTMGVLPKLHFSLEELTKAIKDKGFNLRLCFNLTQALAPEHRNMIALINRAKELGADQLTLRQMYHSQECKSNEDLWVRDNLLQIHNSLPEMGNVRLLEPLPTGAKRYSVNGISVVYDDDCMSYAPAEVVRYLILQPNAKLYTKWDDPASLVF